MNNSTNSIWDEALKQLESLSFEDFARIENKYSSNDNSVANWYMDNGVCVILIEDNIDKV